MQITNDSRPASRIGGGDLPVPIPHPKEQDTVIVASTVSWKSTDGGKTWAPFKGAPGGEDYQNGWINPDNPDIVMLAADQGAVISLNGGETWSNWYNQPTAALYHVAADNAFPYRVCSGQQESGSVCIASRGNYGAISDRDWLPVGVDEYGYVAPDPLDPDIVYGGRTVTRFDRRTGQTSGVGPVGGRGAVGGAPGNFRLVRTMPVVFSEVDKRSLFFANNVLWKTVDGGKNWKQISQDLTRATYEAPKSIGKYLDQESARATQRGVIYTVAPSYKDINRIWAGTDDGLIHTTADGGVTWKDVTPAALTPWAKVSIIDAGRFDPLTAYAAVNTIRLDDLRPHIFKTHDAGKSWTEIVAGVPNGETVNAVREDPKKKGLLFASTERAVYFSIDDGGHWQSLRLNMPATSVRDIIVKDDDLVAATHGRGFWILDDITPLRQIDDRTPDTMLFKPTTAWRVQVEHELGHAVAEGRADGPESAGRRDHRLLPQGRNIRSGYLDDQTAGRASAATVLERRSRARDSGSSERALADLLVPRCSLALDAGGHASLPVGRAPATRSGPAPRPAAALAPFRRSCRFRRFPITLPPLRQPPGPRRGPTRSN